MGKTAIAEGLAQRIVAGDVPRRARNKRLLAWTWPAWSRAPVPRRVRERLKGLIDEISDPKVILFIDEMHTIVGAGGARRRHGRCQHPQAGLAHGELYVHRGDDARRVPQAHREGRGARAPLPAGPGGRAHGGAGHRDPAGAQGPLRGPPRGRIADEASSAAVELSDKYVTDRFLPDKAIDLLDEASAMKHCAQPQPPGKGGWSGAAAGCSGRGAAIASRSNDRGGRDRGAAARAARTRWRTEKGPRPRTWVDGRRHRPGRLGVDQHPRAGSDEERSA